MADVEPPAEKPMRDASTVLLLSDFDDGVRVFMVKRHHRNVFMANAHVFVGGRVDAADHGEAIEVRTVGPACEALAARLGLPRGEARRGLGFYVAALREAFEECGLLVARDGEGRPLAEHPLLAQARAALNAQATEFDRLLVELDAYLDLGALRYLAHWITPPSEPKLYDTRFFVARAPRGQRASFDPKETTAGQWMRPRDVLDAARADTILLAPPTLCVLEDLQNAPDVDTALACAEDCPQPAIRPKLLQGVQPITVVLPEDHRYADPGSKTGTEHYLERHGKHWRRFRNFKPA